MTDDELRRQRLEGLRQRRGTRVAPVPHAGQSQEPSVGAGKLRAALKARMEGGNGAGGLRGGGGLGDGNAGQGGRLLARLRGLKGDAGAPDAGKAELRKAILQTIQERRQGSGQGAGARAGAGNGQQGPGRGALRQLLQQRAGGARNDTNDERRRKLQQLISQRRAQNGGQGGSGEGPRRMQLKGPQDAGGGVAPERREALKSLLDNRRKEADSDCSDDAAKSGRPANAEAPSAASDTTGEE